MTVYDLGDISRIVDRPDATPAPTAGPGDPPIPTGPWAPTVAFKTCGCGVLTGESCDCADLAAQLEAHLARPIFFRFDTRRAA